MSFDLSDYTTVAERIQQFYTDYPAGVISTQPAKLVTVGDHTYVSVIARVWLDRTMEAISTEAEAWEVWPGKTPYTRDSEMMNAATSAIGRALMQLGIGITKAGAASADEVRVAQERRTESEPTARTYEPIRNPAIAAKPISEGQARMIWAICHKQGLHKETEAFPALEALTGHPVTKIDDVQRGDVDTIKNATEEQWATARLRGAGLTVDSANDELWGGTPW